jgi:hypothetical protein
MDYSRRHCELFCGSAISSGSMHGFSNTLLCSTLKEALIHDFFHVLDKKSPEASGGSEEPLT